jgi:hypothetical protein
MTRSIRVSAGERRDLGDLVALLRWRGRCSMLVAAVEVVRRAAMAARFRRARTCLCPQLS